MQSDVDMSNLVSSEVTLPPPTAIAATGPTSKLNVIKTESASTEATVVSKSQQLSTVCDEQAGGQAKMTLGQMALAGIVISSGPGDHFETYEG